jgi:hypothetical protein
VTLRRPSDNNPYAFTRDVNPKTISLFGILDRVAEGHRPSGAIIIQPADASNAFVRVHSISLVDAVNLDVSHIGSL